MPTPTPMSTSRSPSICPGEIGPCSIGRGPTSKPTPCPRSPLSGSVVHLFFYVGPSPANLHILSKSRIVYRRPAGSAANLLRGTAPDGRILRLPTSVALISHRPGILRGLRTFFQQAELQPILNSTHDNACCRKCLFQIWIKTSKYPETISQKLASRTAVDRPYCRLAQSNTPGNADFPV